MKMQDVKSQDIKEHDMKLLRSGKRLRLNRLSRFSIASLQPVTTPIRKMSNIKVEWA